MAIKTKDIISFFENQFSSLKRQYEWDSNGVQLLVHDKKISKIVFALDPSEDAIDYAIKQGCELLITHHPFFFRAVKNIDFTSVIGRKIVKSVKSDLNIISYHTVLDRADFSLNDYLAKLIGAKVLGGFTDFGKEDYYKFVVFVPKGYEKDIIDAIDKAGGGKIGNYSKCTFYADGTGTFLPEENTSPFIGEKGKLEETPEYRLETIVPAKNLGNVVNAVLSVHPYEEVAYDIYKLEMGKEYSLGRICELDDSVTLEGFINLLSEKLGITDIRHNASDLLEHVDKFAIVTGSGAGFWKDCLRAGLNLLVTGDMKHHDAVDAYESGVTVIDVGHFESESVFMKYLAELIKDKFNVDTIYYENKCKIKNWRQDNA